MLGLLDSARIVADATAYRLKKREMGNLVTSATLALGLSLPPRDVAHRVVFGLVLNVFVYLVNDLFDVEIDQHAAGRDVERTSFLAAHLRAGVVGAALVLAIAAALAAAHGRDLLIVLGVNVLVIVLYSRWLKRRPIVDILSMATWGASMALVGCPLDSEPGWAMIGLLAILCMVTEGVQVIRDAETDRAAGLRTTAAALGVERAAWLTRALIVAAAAYTTLALDAWVGPLLLLGLATRLDTAHANQSWDRLRVLFGGAWLLLVGHYWVLGRLSGALR